MRTFLPIPFQLCYQPRLSIKAVIVLWLTIPLLFSACSKLAEVHPDQLGYDYFPLETGQYLQYDVTDMTYSLSDAPQAVHYQVKEVVKEEFTDLTGKESYRIERSIRNQVADPWELDSVWTAQRTSINAIRVESNVPFVKLVFPLREKVKWNGNAFNNREEEEYQIKNLSKRYSVSGQDFDETLTVWQSTDSSLVSQDKRMEVYARNIGLIYQEKVIVQFCSNSDCLGKGQIDFGVKHIQKIIGYGKE
jgi:hypothetical protein